MASAGHVRRPTSGAAWHEHRSRLLNASWRSIMTSSSLTTDIPDTLTLKHYAGMTVVSSSLYFLLCVAFQEGCRTVVPSYSLSGVPPQPCLVNSSNLFFLKPQMCTFELILSWMLFMRMISNIYLLLLAISSIYPTFS